jgi:hypothetical protein
VSRKQFGKSFADFIERHAPELRPKYGMENVDSWPEVSEAQRPPKPGGASGNDPRLGYIYREKIAEDVYTALDRTGLATLDRGGDPRWIGMHPRLAWVYMTALAEELSDQKGLRPLTDETRDHIALSGLSHERLAHALLADVLLVDSAPTATEIESVLVSVAFQAVVPEDLPSLSVDKVLQFRDKYPNERAQFQGAVAQLLESREWLRSIDDRGVLEDRLHDEYDKHWAANLRQLKESLKSIGINSFIGCFSLKSTLPTAVLAGQAALGVSLDPIAAATAAIALGAIPVIRDKRKEARDALQGSPVSYLYRMEQNLEPKKLWGRVKQGALQFALNV